jgi:hypothetical protein
MAFSASSGLWPGAGGGLGSRSRPLGASANRRLVMRSATHQRVRWPQARARAGGNKATLIAATASLLVACTSNSVTS